jgi:predicted DNA-binding protein
MADSKQPNRIVITLDPEQLETLDMIKKRDGISKSKLIKQLIDQYLENDKDQLHLEKLEMEEQNISKRLEEIQQERNNVDQTAPDFILKCCELLNEQMQQQNLLFQVRTEKFELQKRMEK